MVSQFFSTVENCPQTSQRNDQMNHVARWPTLTGATSAFGFGCRFAAVIFPHHSLCGAQPHRNVSHDVFSFQFCANVQQEKKRQLWKSYQSFFPLKYIKEDIILSQFSAHIWLHVTLFFYFKGAVWFAESLGERSRWLHVGQRVSTVLCLCH